MPSPPVTAVSLQSTSCPLAPAPHPRASTGAGRPLSVGFVFSLPASLPLSYTCPWHCSAVVLRSQALGNKKGLWRWVGRSLSLLCVFFFFLRLLKKYGCGPCLRSLLNLWQYYFCFMFWFFGQEECGILASQPAINLAPPAVEGEVNHWTAKEVPFRMSSSSLTATPQETYVGLWASSRNKDGQCWPSEGQEGKRDLDWDSTAQPVLGDIDRGLAGAEEGWGPKWAGNVM